MLGPSDKTELPPIPSRRYFTIGEVSRLCDVKPHILRYWEQEFPRLKPTKRRGNRRYYQHKDVVIARQIRRLIYDEGFTVSGARQRLTTPETPNDDRDVKLSTIREIRAELEEILQLLQE